MGLFDRLSGLNLDDISRKLTDFSQEAFNQGASLADSARNKMKSSDLEKQINAQYAELGKIYYKMIKDNPDDACKDIVTRIGDLDVQLEYYRAEARKERGITLCSKCGAEVSFGTAYCPSCGSIVQQPGVMTTIKCPQCGTNLPEGTKFCNACGTDVSQVAPTAMQMPLGQIDLNGGNLSSPAQTTGFAAPVTQQPSGFAAPAPQQQTGFAAPVTQQTTGFAAPAPQQQTGFAAPAAQQPSGFAAPAAQQPSGFAAPATQQVTGFPNGSPSTVTMDIDTKTIYGDTNAPAAPIGLTLEKNDFPNSGNTINLNKD